jgi:hypothetical protein
MKLKELKHAAFAFAAQLIIGLATSELVLAGMVGCGFFVGREHAQAEYRWIEKYGQWRRYNLRWHNVFDKRIWDVHSFWWNLTFPIIVVAAVAIAAELIKGA